MLNVAFLLPEAQRATRIGLVSALNDHCGSPGRLAIYRRKIRKDCPPGQEDPSIFATELETLAIPVRRDWTSVVCFSCGKPGPLFYVNCFDDGPVRLASIAYAGYLIAVLRDGSKPATHTAHSRKAEHSFLDDVSLTRGQQVAVMFQIMCAFALDVPATAECATDFHGVSPYVLLAYEPCCSIRVLPSRCIWQVAPSNS